VKFCRHFKIFYAPSSVYKYEGEMDEQDYGEKYVKKKF